MCEMDVGGSFSRAVNWGFNSKHELECLRWMLVVLLVEQLTGALTQNMSWNV